MKIIGATVNPWVGVANPPSLKIIVDEDPVLTSTEFYHVEGNPGGRDSFIRVRNFTLGALSTCVFPIPSCFSEVRTRHRGAGQDYDYGLVDGWYDSGANAVKAGIIDLMVEVAITTREGGGGVIYSLPVETIREVLEEFCPEWILGDPKELFTEGYYTYYASLYPKEEE
jgi:hypothetical protein